MVKKISVKEAQSLLPKLTQNLDTHDSFVIECDGQLRLVILSAKEYARFKMWERREVIRSRIFDEMEQRPSRSNWTEAFKLMETLSQRAQVSDDDLHRLIDDAVFWARAS